MIAYVGLDVHQDTVTAALLRDDGAEATKRWSVPNNRPGSLELTSRLAALGIANEATELHIGLESTGLCGWHLAKLLSEDGAVPTCRTRVFLLNPLRVKYWRRTMSSASKNDWRDPYVIADFIRMGRDLPAPFHVDMVYAPLQRLTRYRYHAAHALAREKTYFVTMLYLPFSAYGQEEPFSDTFGATSVDVLQEYSTEDLVNASLEDLAERLRKTSKGRLADETKVAKALQQAASDSYHLDQALRDPVRLVLQKTMINIRTMQANLKAVDAAIARELKGIPQTLDSVPGLGPVWTAGLISEIGDIKRFPNDAALASYAGLVWNESSSGHFQSQETSLSKKGCVYLRYYLVEAANSVRVHCPEYAAYYKAKYEQTPKHAHKRALILTARKLVRLVHPLLRYGQLYQKPEDRPPRQDGPTPHNARPGRPHNYPLAKAVGQG